MSNATAGKADVLQGTLDLMILQTVATLGSVHGYTIAARIEQVSNGAIQLNMGTLYPGLMRLDEAEPWIGTLWEGESDTVGGRVLEAFGHLPDVGATVVIDGVHVEVEQVVDRTVASVLATPVLPAGEGNGG